MATASSDRIEQVSPPAGRDPLWFSPVLVLAPARSNSTVVTAMIGMHPELCGFPELALFRRDTVGQLMVDPRGWRGAPAKLRLAGLLRSLAELNSGEQTEATIAEAEQWLRARQGWRVEFVFDHLLRAAAPRLGIEKSPENSSHERYFARLTAAYPRARYLHLTRHPIPSVESMHQHWSKLDYWDLAPELFHHFCVGVWYHQHRRIHDLMCALPPDRALQVRSEDVVNSPHEALPRICRWIGIEASAPAIEAMCHPERSPHARIGPVGALGGGSSDFLRDPVLHRARVPDTLERPPDWLVDPWQWLATVELAREFGY